MDRIIYKIVPRTMWNEACAAGRFDGAPIDREHGFIHLSTGGQVQETAARHFRDVDDLLLVAVDATKLGDALKYERSRNGAFFPHLYGHLPLDAVSWIEDLPRGSDGLHLFPATVR